MMSSYPVQCNTKESLFNIMTSVNQEASPNKRICYKVITRGSVTKNDILFDSLGYSYLLNKERSNGNDALWLCSMRKPTLLCEAAVQHQASIFCHNQVLHSHPPKPNEYINIIIQQSINEKLEQGFVRDFQDILNEIFEELKIPKFYVNGKWQTELKNYFKLRQQNATSENDGMERNFLPSLDSNNSSEDEDNSNNCSEENLNILGSVMRLTPDTTFYDPSNSPFSTEAIVPPRENENQDSEVVKDIFSQLVETVQNFSDSDLIPSKSDDNSISGDDYISNFTNLKDSTIDSSDFMSDVGRFSTNLAQINEIKDAQMTSTENRFVPLLENGKATVSYLETRDTNCNMDLAHDGFEEPIKITNKNLESQTIDTNTKVRINKEQPLESSFNCVTFPKESTDSSLNIDNFRDFVVNPHPPILGEDESPEQILGEGNESKEEQNAMLKTERMGQNENDSLTNTQFVNESSSQSSSDVCEGENGYKSQDETGNPPESTKWKTNALGNNTCLMKSTENERKNSLVSDEDNSENVFEEQNLLNSKKCEVDDSNESFSTEGEKINNFIKDNATEFYSEGKSCNKHLKIENLDSTSDAEEGEREESTVKEGTPVNGSKMDKCLISVKKDLHIKLECNKETSEEETLPVIDKIPPEEGDTLNTSLKKDKKGFLGFPPQGGKRKVEGIEEENSTSTKRSRGSIDKGKDLDDSTLEDMFNDDENSAHSIIIGEAFTINEEQMKELEDPSDIEAKTVKQSSGTLSSGKSLDVEPSDDTAYSSNHSEDLPSEGTETAPNKESQEDSELPSKPATIHPKVKKVKRSSFFKPVKRKKKLTKGGQISSPVAVAPQRMYEVLPAFLQELAGIDPALVMLRDRLDEEGNRLRVACIALHETVLDWAFTDTLLSSFDSARTLRSRLSLPSRMNLLFPNEVGDRGNAFHPVQLGLDFPFSMPKGTKAEEGVEEEPRLPYPLEQFVLLCPSAVGDRILPKDSKPLKTVMFTDEPLEWAFKETFLSTFEDSPILSDLLGLTATTREWPDVAEEILAHEGVDFSFPFACPPAKKHLEGLLFHEFSVTLPPTLLHETLQLPPLPSDLERRLSGERDALVRLLGLASFYKHASCIPTVRSNRKLSLSHAALVSSFRPMVISQANSLAFVIREARSALLKGVTCQDPNIIPALIRGPIPSKRGLIFANVHKLEAAVAKDPNNKLQYI